MRALQALKSAGWRVASRAFEVPAPLQWHEGRWRVEFARALEQGHWYLLDVRVADEAEQPAWLGGLHSESGIAFFHALFQGARSKTFFHCERPVRAIALRPSSARLRVGSLRVVRIPRPLALRRVLAMLRAHLKPRAADRWTRIARQRGKSADSSLFIAYRHALSLACGAAAVPETARGAGTRRPAAQPKARQMRRALCIDAVLPRPDRDAGSYAAVQEMRLLQALGYELSFRANPGDGDARVLEEMGIDVLPATQAADPGELLRGLGPGLDLVYLTRHYVARDWIAAARQHAPQAKLVLNVADLHFVRQAREAALFADPAAMQALEAGRRAELEVIDRVDQVLCYSQTEIALLQACGVSGDKLSRCPWVAEVPEPTQGFAAREGIAFLGGYGHPPNVDAAIHFVLDLLPLIRRRRNDIVFRIYGSNVPPELQALRGAGVEVRGYVPDVATAYDGCRVFVAPLRYGAGLKGKVVTALARGTPSVLSPVAAEGLFYLSGAEAAIAETPREWADHVLAYYDDEALWSQCANAAREFARRNFSFGHGRRLMAQALERAGVRLP
jgi:glycosyltransferase involved in cell wall biosynthesis